MDERSKDVLALITKIEFHEGKNRNWSKPFVELYTYVSDLEKFIRLCSEEDSWLNHYSGGKQEFDYYMARARKSRAQRPHFDFYVGSRMEHTEVIIYPKENLVVHGQVGLHYICQHLFDFFPHEAKSVFYQYQKSIGDFVIGKLKLVHKGETLELDVKASDILDGFMLHREQIDAYRDTFSIWILHRRQAEKKTEKNFIEGANGEKIDVSVDNPKLKKLQKESVRVK